MDIPCPNCGEQSLRIHCASEATVSCADCETEWSTEELRKLAGDLVKLADWVDTAPFRAP